MELTSMHDEYIQSSKEEEIIDSREEAPIIMGDSPPLNEEEERENSRFKDGDILTMIRVRFPGNAKSFPFLLGKKRIAYGQKVVAMSDRGMTVGYVNSFPYEIAFNKAMLPVRSIAKIASDEDIKAQKEFRDSEKKAEVICLRLIEKHSLDMILTHVEFIQFGKKAVFYFNAPARVDFRELVKDLVYELKMRIELRQISVRDRSAALGSIGACGLQTCCSSFLKNYGNVSIKMAKNQNLALIPSKLNGVCGQIKCCIRFEDEIYIEKRKFLPKENSFIKTLNGDRGKVQKLILLESQFEMLTDQGVRRKYYSTQYDPKTSELNSDYKFPESFDNIINETQNAIGTPKKEDERALSEELKDSNYDQELDSTDDISNSEVKNAERVNNDHRPPREHHQKRHHHNNHGRKGHHHHKNRNNQSGGNNGNNRPN